MAGAVPHVDAKGTWMPSPPRCCCSTRSGSRSDMRMLMTSSTGRTSARVVARSTLLALAVACNAGSTGRPVRVVVPPGATLAQAGDSLEKAGVIGSRKIFRLYAALRRDDRSIKPGTYLLRRNSSMSRVLDALREGKGLVEVVTIPEGFALS